MIQWTMLDTWIVVVGALSAMACALVGNFLVLRRLSLMGDAISHTVLPGLAIAFLITGTRDSLPMFIGACVLGVVTALLIQVIHRAGSLDEGATMGVVFTTLFALGLVLIRRSADHVDLDPDCVLYGAIELTPLDVRSVFGMWVPAAVITNGAMLLLNALAIGLLYKEFKISSFDPDHATSLGIPSGWMHYTLMALVAATCVAAFESVGSILVIAMLIVPGACAHLLTDRLSVMIALSLVIAALSAVVGHWLAIAMPEWVGVGGTSTAGMMASVSGAIFLGVILLAPRYGVISRVVGRELFSRRIAREDVLALLYRREEMLPGAPVAAGDAGLALVGRKRRRNALRRLHARGLVQRTADGYRLSRKGLDAARDLIRKHRLWETYLVDRAGLPPGKVHNRAEALEHVTTKDMEGRLGKVTGSPRKDPHQRDIPSERE